MAEKFKLQTVLKYRKTLEEQAQQRLAELLAVEARIREAQAAARAEFEELTCEIVEKQKEGMSILDLRLYEDQIVHRRQQCDRLQLQLEELQEQLDERRHELMTAARERKMIEKLKEKQLAEYLRKLDRKERAQLDEISLRQKGGSA